MRELTSTALKSHATHLGNGKRPIDGRRTGYIAERLLRDGPPRVRPVGWARSVLIRPANVGRIR